MTIGLMRCLDYWLGIPLCFLFDGINYISRPFILRKKENTTSPKILFIKLSEIGSIILAYSLICMIREECPESEIFFLTFEKNKDLLEILDIVPCSNILTIKENSVYPLILDTLRAIKKVRKNKIDTVFDLEFFSRFTAILTYLSNASKKIGFYRYSMEGLYRGNFLTHRVQYNPFLHISKSYLSLWQAAKAKVKSTPELEKKIENREISLPKFILSKEAEMQMWAKLREYGINEKARLLLVNPGEGNIPLREWALENFITLVRRLLEDRRNYIIIVCARTLSKKAQLLCRSVNNERCVDLSNKTTISEVLILCKIAQVLLTNDSGLAHLASLTPIKKFILFGPEYPQVYSPLGENTWIIHSDLPCSPCFLVFNHRKSACKDNKCLKAIRVDEIVNLLKNYL